MTKATLYEELSVESLQEEEKFTTLTARAVSSRKIPRFYGVLYLPPEELEKATPTLKGCPVLKDHEPSVDNVIGRVREAYFKEGAVYAELELYKNDPLVDKIKEGLVKSLSVGFERDLIWSDEKQCFLAKNIRFKEISFVVMPADPTATVLSEEEAEFFSEDIAWVKDPEKRKKAPSDYFLDPSSRRYPYKTWSGEVSCELLRRAMSLASLHGHTQIYERAKSLYERHCKEKQSSDCGCEKLSEVSNMHENLEALKKENEELKKEVKLLKKEIEELKPLAEAGKAYVESLREETKKFIKVALGDNSPMLSIVDSLSDIGQLKAIHDEYERLARQKLKPSSREALPEGELEGITPEKLEKMSYKELLELKEKFAKEVN